MVTIKKCAESNPLKKAIAVALKAGLSRKNALSLTRAAVDVDYTDGAVNAKMKRLKWGAEL